MPPRSPRGLPPAAALLAALALALAAPAPAASRKVWAEVPYTLKGGVTVLSAGGQKGTLDVGGKLLMDLELQSNGSAAGRLHASCDAVGPAGGGAVRVLCTKHYEWDGGASVMVAHATELYKPGSPVTGPVTGPVTVVGGIGRWQGAHGEDLEFKFDPKTGRGGGKIVLYCLDGRC